MKLRLIPQTASLVMNSRNTSALRIDIVHLASGGENGMTLCPGKKQRGVMSGDWNRDLAEDLDVIVAWVPPVSSASSNTGNCSRWT